MNIHDYDKVNVVTPEQKLTVLITISHTLKAVRAGRFKNLTEEIVKLDALIEEIKQRK